MAQQYPINVNVEGATALPLDTPIKTPPLYAPPAYQDYEKYSRQNMPYPQNNQDSYEESDTDDDATDPENSRKYPEISQENDENMKKEDSTKLSSCYNTQPNWVVWIISILYTITIAGSILQAINSLLPMLILKNFILWNEDAYDYMTFLKLRSEMSQIYAADYVIASGAIAAALLASIWFCCCCSCCRKSDPKLGRVSIMLALCVAFCAAVNFTRNWNQEHDNSDLTSKNCWSCTGNDDVLKFRKFKDRVGVGVTICFSVCLCLGIIAPVFYRSPSRKDEKWSYEEMNNSQSYYDEESYEEEEEWEEEEDDEEETKKKKGLMQREVALFETTV